MSDNINRNPLMPYDYCDTSREDPRECLDDDCDICNLKFKITSLTAKNAVLEKKLKDARDAYDHLANEYRNLDNSYRDYRDQYEKLQKLINPESSIRRIKTESK